MEQPQLGVVAGEWQLVWQEHAGWLRTVLRARVKDDLIADELLQAVNVSAWTHRNQLSDDSRVGPWLYRIALRQVLMFWRREGRRRQRFKPLDLGWDGACDRGDDPLTWLARTEVHEQVRQALALMCAQDREILMLKHSEQWTYRQIADYLGLTMDTVVHRLARARNRLRKQLVQFDIDGEQL